MNFTMNSNKSEIPSSDKILRCISLFILMISTILILFGCQPVKEDKALQKAGFNAYDSILCKNFGVDFVLKDTSYYQYSHGTTYNSNCNFLDYANCKAIFNRLSNNGLKVGQIYSTFDFYNDNREVGNYMIQYYDKLHEGKTKANYIRWRNLHDRRIVGDIVLKANFFDDRNIDSTTVELITNMDSTIIKKWFPDVKCKIQIKKYKRIIVDFSKAVWEQDFYRSIKFIE